MAEQDQDRNLPATPHKLREARKKGQVAKSQEVNSLVTLSALLLAIYCFGQWAVQKQSELGFFILDSSSRVIFEKSHLISWFTIIAQKAIAVLLPFVMAAMILGVASNLLQMGGPVISFFPLKPDINRINPVEGFKRVFSFKMVIEAIKTIIKISVFGVVGYFCLKALIPMFFSLMGRDPTSYPVFLLEGVTKLLSRLLIVVLIVAIIDLIFTRWDFAKKMKMSFRDLKDEVKKREGDPDIRSKRKLIQKELMQKIQSVAEVPNADVVITNPTHFAVALKYDSENMNAPEIIAKGAGQIALRMREIARENNVKIVENKPLARKLFFSGEIDMPVPEALFSSVAHILAWVYGLRPDLTEGVAR